MEIVVITSQKGGSGKTTVTAHLAVAAERVGHGPSVVIDTDPPANPRHMVEGTGGGSPKARTRQFA